MRSSITKDKCFFNTNKNGAKVKSRYQLNLIEESVNRVRETIVFSSFCMGVIPGTLFSGLTTLKVFENKVLSTDLPGLTK